jgi:hypothetical protein
MLEHICEFLCTDPSQSLVSNTGRSLEELVAEAFTECDSSPVFHLMMEAVTTSETWSILYIPKGTGNSQHDVCIIYVPYYVSQLHNQYSIESCSASCLSSNV